MLTGKTVILGVCGGIAAYKSAMMASLLKKNGANVQVIMTKNATQFIAPLTFEELTGRRCLVDTFDRNFEYNVQHIAVAKEADLVLIAPATANVIAKLSHGLADDMLTTTVLACTCPKVVVPAMNTNMYENPITQDNLALLKKYGMEVVVPKSGLLACGDVGIGKMPEPAELLWYVLRHLACEKNLQGKKVLITAGPTQETIDPVRYITNHSSGKMGYSLAKLCMLHGAQVTLVTGETNLEPPRFVEVIPVKSAKEMFEAVKSKSEEMDVIIKAAAVADYRPAHVSDEKMKKKDSEMSIELERTDDILKYLGEHKKDGQILCGFSMETQNMVENSKRKLTEKKLDMIVANNLKEKGAGFGVDTNKVTIITEDEITELDLMSKDLVAEKIIDIIQEKVK
ncbi:bifunctional phosphopantothenoylcysteine decarboxylase/phosphopantothenate--cysteine ligase CoaBC [Lachnospiraceae bacterium OttesenSCG-928-E19]|nr:bifunctional phosphopantothenoylcysteine decarboxylase/phosphopantothenate--cysteine ligase CoaBC [Lachnospiraceae bacterium OttesenSCG-928-E19]